MKSYTVLILVNCTFQAGENRSTIQANHEQNANSNGTQQDLLQQL